MNEITVKKDLSNLCIHTITTKPWSFEKSLEEYCKRGIGGISIWADSYSDIGMNQATKLLQSYPIDVVSYVRGGFFAHTSSQKKKGRY